MTNVKKGLNSKGGKKHKGMKRHEKSQSVKHIPILTIRKELS